jgi:site-specific DNA-methyltransferase (adenine-specific)
MLEPYYQDRYCTIYHGDALEVLPQLGPVDLVLTDPPYFRVLDEDWDRQWGSVDDFLVWLGGIIDLCLGVMRDNGTIYTFSAPKLAASVETLIAQRARVIASCVWDKGQGRRGVAGTGIDVTALRTYWSSGTERCTVAEKRPLRYDEADAAAREACGYWTKCQESKRSVFGDYLRKEFERSGVTNKQIAALFPSRTGGLTGCVSNWLLDHNRCPTKEQYYAMRAFLNDRDGEFLCAEYEDLRRPFNLTASHQWGDLWRWPVERNERAHPAQKPLGLIRQLVEVSSRPDSLVLDPFMGSGTTLVAAKELGRHAIGIEISREYCDVAVKRLRQEVLF